MNEVILSDKASIKAEMEKELGSIFDKAVEVVKPKIAGSLLFGLPAFSIVEDSISDIEDLVNEGYPKVEPLGDYMDRLAAEVERLKADDSVVVRCPETGFGTLCTVKECREEPCPNKEWHDSREDRQRW
jgi:hypothetical protein